MTALVMASLLLTASPFETPYCRGWDAGLKAGWCRDRPACLPLPPPPCPPPKPGHDKRDDGFADAFEGALRERPRQLPLLGNAARREVTWLSWHG
jgi:hypothetical protein